MSRAALVGNRIALFGALLYLSEWLVIPFFPDVPTDTFGEDGSSIVEAYEGNATRLALLAGWFSFVLIGRVVFVAGLRSALQSSPRELALADVAIGAMIVSVVLEIFQLGLIVPAGWLAGADADANAIVSLDAASSALFTLIFAPLGVSVVASSLAMLLSGLFARWLCWLGLVAGALLVAGGVLATGGKGTTGALHDVGEALLVGVPAFWIWMIATAVVLVRHAPPLRGRPPTTA